MKKKKMNVLREDEDEKLNPEQQWKNRKKK